MNINMKYIKVGHFDNNITRTLNIKQKGWSDLITVNSKHKPYYNLIQTFILGCLD